MQKVRGRPCPFVALDAANSVAAELMQLVLSDSMRALAPRYLDAVAEGLPGDEVRSVILRVQGALGAERVQRALYPEHYRAMEKQKGRGRG